MNRNLNDPSVLYVTSEVYPLVKTGGLADVSAALPAALRELGSDCRILMPGYAGVAEQTGAQPVSEPYQPLSASPTVRILEGRIPDTGVPVYVVDCPQLYQRSGGPYSDPGGHEWPDNAIRFGVLSKVGADIATDVATSGWVPELVQCNDWQSGLLPAYLALSSNPGPMTVMGIHNLAFQGNFSPHYLPRLDLPWVSFQQHGVEFYGQLSFLKAGLFYADWITTVSPTYAAEICTAEFGNGMEGLLSHHSDRLTGILNGIDKHAWNPASDRLIDTRYGPTSLYRKRANKTALQQQLGLRPDPQALVLGMVSRMTWQKGSDLVLELAAGLTGELVQFTILGSGDPELEARWRRLASQHPNTVAVCFDYDETLAHRIEAGADLFLMPSRFEPSGLNQMYSQRYGTPPVVRHTGGLADSVTDTTPASLDTDTATGFVFENATTAELKSCVLRALVASRDKPTWRQIQRRGMSREFAWQYSATRYLELYRALLHTARHPETSRRGTTPGRVSAADPSSHSSSNR